MLKKLATCFLLGTMFLCTSLKAQELMRYNTLRRLSWEADEAKRNQLYQQAFTTYADYLKAELATNQHTSFLVQEAVFHQLVCALHLKKNRAELQLIEFLEQTPYDVFRNYGQYELARYAFRTKNYAEAIRFYDLAGIHFLDNDEISQRNFELAYACLVLGQMDRVGSLFASVKNIPGENFNAGNYYHGLMAYYQRNFDDARKSFTKIADDPNYKYVVPFYLIEMDYLEGNKEGALEKAARQLQSRDTWYYQNELNLIAAQVCLDQNKISEARNYLTTYYSKKSELQNDDYFRLGYVAYADQATDEALRAWKKLKPDAGVQYHQAQYLSGMLCLKAGRHAEALNFIRTSADLEAVPELKQNARTLLPRVSYQQADLDDFLEDTKTALRWELRPSERDTIQFLRIYKLLTKGQMKMATSYIEQWPGTPKELKRFAQRLSYANGLKALMDSKPQEAKLAFEESRLFTEDAVQSSSALFWLAESAYRLQEYQQALTYCKLYQNEPEETRNAERVRQLNYLQAFAYANLQMPDSMTLAYALYEDTTLNVNWRASLSDPKPEFVPDRIPDASLDPPSIALSRLDLQLQFPYTPLPLTPLALDKKSAQQIAKHFIELGVGSTSTLRFRSGYDFTQWMKFPFYLSMRYQGFRGGLPNQRMTETEIQASASRRFLDKWVHGKIIFDRRGYSYYGYDRTRFNYDQRDLRQRFTGLRIQLNADSLVHVRSSIHHKPEAGVFLYGDRYGSFESGIYFKDQGTRTLRKDLQALMSVEARLFAFRSSRSVQNNSLLGIQVGVRKHLEEGYLQMALKPFLGQEFHVLPDIHFVNNLDMLNARAGLHWEGTLQQNTFRDLTLLNPFVFSHYTVKQSRQTDLRASLQGNLDPSISYSVYSGVRWIRNLPIFVNDTASDGKQFHIDYESRATLFTFQAEASYQPFKSFTLHGHLEYAPVLHTNSGQKAWHYQPFQAELKGDYTFLRKWHFASEILLRGGYYSAWRMEGDPETYSRQADPGLEINLRAGYTANRVWNLYAELNNLSGSQYQRWYGYPQWGRQILLGAVYSFSQDNPVKRQ